MTTTRTRTDKVDELHQRLTDQVQSLISGDEVPAGIRSVRIGGEIGSCGSTAAARKATARLRSRKSIGRR